MESTIHSDTLDSFPNYQENSLNTNEEQTNPLESLRDGWASSNSSSSSSLLLPDENEGNEVFGSLKGLVTQSKFGQWANKLSKSLQARRRKSESISKPRVYYSVFMAPSWVLHAEKHWEEYPHYAGYDYKDYVRLLDATKEAIAHGVFPVLISKGSSGSYFVKNKVQKNIAVFKPKDEEPYGKLNPKWTKWFHRNLFPCFFGRSCLIPNTSYLSEAAACVLDRGLGLYLVPYTSVASISSPTFNYDYFARKAFLTRNKPLPEKTGSFQQFLDGFVVASKFFAQHPWPGTRHRETREYTESVASSEDFDIFDPFLAENEIETEFWTEELRLKFRFEFEKLVLLDYLMRNTDRNLDNWMIKICYEPCDNEEYYKSINLLSTNLTPNMSANSVDPAISQTPDFWKGPHFQIGAIDNSLAFPYKHPDSWRSFPYGWLSLPRSLFTQPFTEFTRQLFLHKLTSREWWEKLSDDLRNVFNQDLDFDEKMFSRQLSLVKGQAYNIVEVLKNPLMNIYDLLELPNLYVVEDVVRIEVNEPTSANSEEAEFGLPIKRDYGSILHPSCSQTFPPYPGSQLLQATPGRSFSSNAEALLPLNYITLLSKDSSSPKMLKDVIFERLQCASSNAVFSTC